jgi:hypothetical protein
VTTLSWALPSSPASEAVTRQVGQNLRSLFVNRGMWLRAALVNGAAGAVVTANGRFMTEIGFTIPDDKLVEIAQTTRR